MTEQEKTLSSKIPEKLNRAMRIFIAERDIRLTQFLRDAITDRMIYVRQQEADDQKLKDAKGL